MASKFEAVAMSGNQGESQADSFARVGYVFCLAGGWVGGVPGVNM